MVKNRRPTRTDDIFEKLMIEAFRAGVKPRTQESLTWFRKRAQRIRRATSQSILHANNLELKDTGVVGSMFHWLYDPKTKSKLPYYDMFPLGIILGPKPGASGEAGFHALNLHYLPPLYRARLFGKLREITNNQKYDKSMKMEVTYALLKEASNLKEYKPCFKHYLESHVVSAMALIPPPEWEVALFLPSAKWKKGTSRQVYRDSRSIING